MGQHSPSGMMGSAQSEESSQMTSSHITVPLSQTQIWHGSGFHTSLSLYNCPSSVQLPNAPAGQQRVGQTLSPHKRTVTPTVDLTQWIITASNSQFACVCHFDTFNMQNQSRQVKVNFSQSFHIYVWNLSNSWWWWRRGCGGIGWVDSPVVFTVCLWAFEAFYSRQQW